MLYLLKVSRWLNQKQSLSAVTSCGFSPYVYVWAVARKQQLRHNVTSEPRVRLCFSWRWMVLRCKPPDMLTPSEDVLTLLCLFYYDSGSLHTGVNHHGSLCWMAKLLQRRLCSRLRKKKHLSWCSAVWFRSLLSLPLFLWRRRDPFFRTISPKVHRHFFRPIWVMLRFHVLSPTVMLGYP